MGYDNDLEIKKRDGTKTKGALIIRNSWGTSFGDHGYCYLPYEYVLSGLADDFWVMLKGEWIESGMFQI
jgi:C1A family cysteine protease